MKVYLRNHDRTIIIKSEADMPWGGVKMATTEHIIFYSRGAQIYAMGREGVTILKEEAN